MRTRRGRAGKPNDEPREGFWLTMKHDPDRPGVWLHYVVEDSREQFVECIGWFGSHEAARWYVEQEFGCF